jgi:hypothetical protein
MNERKRAFKPRMTNAQVAEKYGLESARQASKLRKIEARICETAVEDYTGQT